MGSGGKSKQTTTAQTVSTPTPAPFLASGYQNLAQGADRLMGLDPSSFLTPANANQTGAFAAAGQGTGDPTAAGVGATNGLLNYRAPSITAGQLSGTDLNPYMNPFQQQVIDATTNDAANANAIGLNQIRSGTPTGAFNGSRAGVAEGQFTSDSMRNLSSLIANLRSGNFSQAQNAASTDIGNRLSADNTNASNDLASAGLRLNAGQQSANLGLLAAGNKRADVAQQLDAGNQQRAIDQSNNPQNALLQLLQAYGGLYGQIPAAAFTGQSGSSTGTQTGTYTPGALDVVDSISKLVAAVKGGGIGK